MSKLVHLNGTIDKDGNFVDKSEQFPDSEFGVLAIEEIYQSFHRPKLSRGYYLVVSRCRKSDYSSVIGEELRDIGNGLYMAMTGMKFQIEGGGRARPFHTVLEDVSKPKTRLETRYRNGRWEKLTKNKGWVIA